MNSARIFRIVVIVNVASLILLPLLFGSSIHSSKSFWFFINPLSMIWFWQNTWQVLVVLVGVQLLIAVNVGMKTGEGNKTNRNISRFATKKEIEKGFCKISDQELKGSRMSVTDIDGERR